MFAGCYFLVIPLLSAHFFHLSGQIQVFIRERVIPSFTIYQIFFFPLNNETDRPAAPPGSERARAAHNHSIFFTFTSADTGSSRPVLSPLLDLEVLWDSGGSQVDQAADQVAAARQDFVSNMDKKKRKKEPSKIHLNPVFVDPDKRCWLTADGSFLNWVY